MRPERHVPLPGLFGVCKNVVEDELFSRLAAAGFPDIRPAHGCVFGTIGDGGDRLTALAERAHMTKQAVGEMVSELESLGYVERVPDPTDGRAKIVKLTERGQRAHALGYAIFDEIQQRWEKQYGADRVREALDVLRELVGDADAAGYVHRVGLSAA
jgi:DNA-binding MarR family transcriptional regulator